MVNQSIENVTPEVNEEVIVEAAVTENVDTESTETVSNEMDVDQQLEKMKELEKSFAEREKALEESLQKLEKEMERTNYITLLASEGLDEFQGLFDITNVKDQVAFIKNAVNQTLIRHSYQPKDVAQQGQYQKAIEEKDVEGAIGYKLANFFKKK